ASVHAAEGVQRLEQSGKVVLDTNAVIAKVEGKAHDVAAVTEAIGGRTPLVPISVAKEFLKKGDVAALREFLKQSGGGIAKAGQESIVKELQSQGLKAGDARAVASAIAEQTKILTRDRQILKKVPNLAEPY